VTVHGIDSMAELLGMVAAAAGLLLLTIALVVRNRSAIVPGSMGHRTIDDSEHEAIRADGYIDSFSKEIEEAGGGLPLFVRLVTVVALVWLTIYTILYWSTP
jgi:hypothetical protein